jgi:predicted HicB family RNase H-like nuclease
MKDVITYKGFIGSVHFNADDAVFHGKIEGIDDLISFEGQSVKELVKAFRDSVDDYIILCKKADKEPLKSTKGSFNVRISPELHRKAFQKASKDGISLNHLVQKAIEKEVA